MARTMDGGAPPDPAYRLANSAEAALRDDLARGDMALDGAAAVLRYLLGNDDRAIFTDDIVARVRGMIEDLAAQLIAAWEAADPASGPDPLAREALVAALIGDAGLLAHVHALALEWRITTRLQDRVQLDPVLSPLVQSLIGAPEPDTAALAMHLLAAQARFGNAQLRMQLAIGELPGDLLKVALQALRAQTGGGQRTMLAERAIRAGIDERAGRLGLLARLVRTMGADSATGLALAEAGTAIFFTALALAAGAPRDAVVLAASDDHAARLLLLLTAAGLPDPAVDAQFVLLHPDASSPERERLTADRARAILTDTGPNT